MIIYNLCLLYIEFDKPNEFKYYRKYNRKTLSIV